MDRDLLDKAARVRLLLFDVDGVLTDGVILVHSDGSESKYFDIRDGTGLVIAQRQGLTVGLISGRRSEATSIRAAQLGISIVYQEAVAKTIAYDEILRQHGFADEETAFMGDDLLDLPVIARVGFSASPADACAEVRQRVDWVSAANGGRGAAREQIEFILRAKGRWDDVVRIHAGDGDRRR